VGEELRAPVEQAIAMWRGCAQFGVGFPTIASVARGAPREPKPDAWPPREITVTVDDFGRGSWCGSFQGNSIVVHRHTLDAARQPRSCGGFIENLAHEIGHSLGVGHPVSLGAGAAPYSPGVMGSPILANVHRLHSLVSWECTEADRHWMTSSELAQARVLGLAAPERTWDKPLAEVAAAWHRLVYGGGMDGARLFERGVANLPPSARPTAVIQ
jgi:hypothetical protein